MNTKNNDILKQMHQLVDNLNLEEIEEILLENQYIIDHWYQEIEKDIFSQISDEDYINLCNRFELTNQNIKIPLSEIAIKFNNNYLFIPRSFLMAACALFDVSIENMGKLDYIVCNPYFDKMNVLCGDIDGIGIRKCRCDYKIFKNNINKLNEQETQTFESLLASSISLEKSEKLQIIRNIDSISMFQLEELIKIFEDEITQYTNLLLKHIKSLNKHFKKHQQVWKEIQEEIQVEREFEDEKDSLFDKSNNFTPQAIFNYLGQSIIGQDEAKRKIATALYYQNRIYKNTQGIKDKLVLDGSKPTTDKMEIKPIGPLLLTGHTGSGKTYTMQKGAEFSKLNFIHIDTSNLVEEGIVGKSINDIPKDLIRKANYDIGLAEHSIVFFDEYDKLLNKQSGHSIMAQLLRFVEGSDMLINFSQYDDDKNKFGDIKSLSTKKMLIIFGGAFSWISNKSEIGFGKDQKSTKKLSHEDIEKSGFPKELLGRIKQIIIFDKLTKDNYYKILTQSTDSPLNDYINKIKINDDKIIIEDGVLERIAEIASKSDFGARKITQILETLFDDIIFKSPEKKIETFKITLEDLKL